MSSGEAAISALRTAGWRFEPPLPTRMKGLPEPLRATPSTLIRWVTSFATLSSPDEAVWFLAREDYRGGTDDAFAWDAFETFSREASANAAEAAGVAEFWARHTPILLSVRDTYAYVAVREDGAVVAGVEPEFEQATVVAESLDRMLTQIARQGADVVERMLRGEVVADAAQGAYAEALRPLLDAASATASAALGQMRAATGEGSATIVIDVFLDEDGEGPFDVRARFEGPDSYALDRRFDEERHLFGVEWGEHGWNPEVPSRPHGWTHGELEQAVIDTVAQWIAPLLPAAPSGFWRVQSPDGAVTTTVP